MSRRFPVRFAALLVATVTVAEARAQTMADTSRVVPQDTVVVAASKLRSRLAEIATSATVLGARELRAAPARPLFEALSGVPGVHIADLSGSGNQGVVESRGFAAQGQSSYTLVLVDEIPINEMEAERVDWNLLGLAQLDRIEFLRGASSFLYGNASMSGVVNLVTRSATDGPAVWAQAAAGANGRQSAAGGATWASGAARAGLSAAVRRGDGDRDHSEFEGGSVYGHGRIGFGEGWSLGARVLAHSSEQDVPGPLPAPTWETDFEQAGTPLDRREGQVVQGGLDLTGALGESVELRATVGTDVRELDATETIVPVGTLDRSSDSRNHRGELRATWRPRAWSGTRVMLGGELQDGSLESRYFDPAAGGAGVAAGDVSRRSGGVFALAQAPLAGTLVATAGARVDWLRSELEVPGVTDGGTEDNHRAISPTVGLTHALPGGGSAFASWAGSFKAPALELMYDQRPYFVDFDGPGGADPVPLTISNRALEPQRGDHVEGGVRARLLPGLWGEGTLWYAKSKDEIGFDLANFRHENIARSVHYGFEGGFAAGPWRGLDGQVSYAWTRAEFDGGEHDGNQINTVPEHVVGTRWTLRHPARGSVTVEVQGAARQWLDEANQRTIPDYALVHLAATQQLWQLELFGAVRNLLDERYASLAYLTIDAFGQDLPLYFPGAPRSFEVGVRFDLSGGE